MRPPFNEIVPDNLSLLIFILGTSSAVVRISSAVTEELNATSGKSVFEAAFD